MSQENRFVGEHVYPTVFGEKTPQDLESPITTSTFLPISHMVVEQFHECGMSPNDITMLSAIFKLLSIYLVLKRYPILAGLSFLAGYLFDNLDGVKARRYKQETVAGDLFDHISDFSGFFGIVIAIYIRYPMNRYWIAALLVTLLGTAVHMGLNEEFNTNCRGIHQPTNFLRVCTYISQWVEPSRYEFAKNPHDEQLAKQYCDTMIHKMKMTRWMTDVNTVLLISIYLFVQGYYEWTKQE